MTTTLYSRRALLWSVWALGTIGPAVCSAASIEPQHRAAVERAHRTAPLGIDARTLAINTPRVEQGQIGEYARLTPAAFSEPASSSAAQRAHDDDASSAPRTASTVAATLALGLFFFLRRVS